jgi:phosphohistidine phosphatase SixA
VHRPRYDDWTLPKGKLRGDETHAEGALREVEEETGLRCELRFPLPSTTYRDAQDRLKRVRYWAMRALGGEFSPQDEVDEILWLEPGDAQRIVSYERDRTVLRGFGHDGSKPLLVVRHAWAGHRKDWDGDDSVRPLDERGRLQSERLVEQLEGHAFDRIASSPYTRCMDTAVPLAAARDLRVEAREELAEGMGVAALEEVAAEPGAGVLCVHGDVLEELCGEEIKKGATVIFERASRALSVVAVLPPPA